MNVFLAFVLLSGTFTVQAADLTCFSCSAQDEEHCPKVTTSTSIYDVQSCTGSLSHVCAKYYIDMLNGESIVYRSCAPEYVGGTPDSIEFCKYHQSLFQPLIDKYLISSFGCSTCTTFECNT